MPVFLPSSPPEILRAAEKDDSFISKIQNDVSALIRKLFGNNFWVKYKHSSHIISALLYYGFTTLSDRQTLGEEYAGLIEVDKTLRNLPSKTARLVAILLQVLGPRLLEKLLANLEAKVRARKDDIKSAGNLIKAIQVAKFIAKWADKFHLVLFYLLGKHYRISQRLTGIQFITVREYMRSSGYQMTFKVIGTVALVHLLFSLLLSFRDFVEENEILDKDESPRTADLQKKCALCLESRKNTSCTPCGHLFCWNCIMQWLQSKYECPLCREPLQPSRVVPLLNYD